MTAPRLMASRYRGICTRCHGEIREGSMVWWDSDTRRVRHETCPKAGKPQVQRLTEADLDAIFGPGSRVRPMPAEAPANTVELTDADIADLLADL